MAASSRNSPARAQVTDRLPPHDLVSESAVLGCVLLEPQTIANCICELRQGSKAFYDLRHQTIYETMLELFDDGAPIDLITLQNRLSTWGKLDQCGGLTYLATLPDAVPSAQNLPAYLSIVKSKSMLRSLITLCTQSVERAYETNGNGDQFLVEFESQALGIRNTMESASAFVDIPGMVRGLLNDYQAAHAGETVRGISSGFADLDRIAGQMTCGEMIVLAGTPSSGKTTLALNIAAHVANSGNTVGVISLETTGKKVIHRVVCSQAKVPGQAMLRGTATDEQIQDVSETMGRIINLSDNIFLTDKSGLDIKECEAICRRMHQRGARFFVIDYLQLLQASARTEFDRVAKCSTAIKNLCKTLDVPIILVSALNREPVKGNKQRKPKISDLRMSGQIEYDADRIYLLYDPQFKEEHGPDEECREVNCSVSKNKDGALGTARLIFFPKEFRMALSEKRYDDVPDPAAQRTTPEPDPQQSSLPYTDNDD